MRESWVVLCLLSQGGEDVFRVAQVGRTLLEAPRVLTRDQR